MAAAAVGSGGSGVMVEVFFDDLTRVKQEKIPIAAKMKKTHTTRLKIRHKVEDKPHFQGFIWTFPL